MLDFLGLGGLSTLLVAVAGGVVAAFFAWLKGRASGASNARRKDNENDQARAQEIEDAADRARAGGAAGPDAIERLRGHDRIRD